MSETEQITYSAGDLTQAPDLRLLHYNDGVVARAKPSDASSADNVSQYIILMRLPQRYALPVPVIPPYLFCI